MSTWIKICGLTTLADAESAAGLSADALGFVLHSRSPRFCRPDAVRSILSKLPTRLLTVGVWFDEDAEVIMSVAGEIGFGCVQTYNPAAARRLLAEGYEVLPAFPAAKRSTLDNEWRLLGESLTGRVVVDRGRGNSADPLTTAENGFDIWRSAAASFAASTRLVLAGGLTAENVRMALDAFHPGGVDVSSGVESGPGRKDLAKLTRFIEEVRQWDAMVGSNNSADSSSRKR